MQSVCPACNTLNTIDNKFCGSCGASLDTAKVVTEAGPTKVRTESVPQEFTYFSSGDVLVTTTRAVLGATTYAMANITSVAMGVIKPARLWPSVAVLCGLALFVAGLVAVQDDLGAGLTALAIGLTAVGLGIFLLVRAKPKYTVRIASASGETEALTSADRDLIGGIVAAMQRAIVERG